MSVGGLRMTTTRTNACVRPRTRSVTARPAGVSPMCWRVRWHRASIRCRVCDGDKYREPSNMDLIDAIALVLVVLKVLFVIVSVVFLASGLDDLFVDALFFLRAAWRR